MDVQDLAPLVGVWRTEARLPDEDPIRGRASFAWLERGGYLIQRAAMDDARFPVSVSVLGPSADGGPVVQHYFDSRGVARVYEVAFVDGVWRLWRDDPDFPQRFAGRLSADGTRIDGAWEKDLGDGWSHDFALVYVRED